MDFKDQNYTGKVDKLGGNMPANEEQIRGLLKKITDSSAELIALSWKSIVAEPNQEIVKAKTEEVIEAYVKITKEGYIPNIRRVDSGGDVRRTSLYSTAKRDGTNHFSYNTFIEWPGYMTEALVEVIKECAS